MTGSEFISDFLSNDKDYIEALTSGSTGAPKIIHLPKEMMVISALRTNNFFHIKSNCRIHSCVAFDYIGGKMTAVRALCAQCSLTAETPSNRPSLKGDILLNNTESDILNADINILSVVPSQIPYLLDHRDNLPLVHNYLIGGSAIPSNIREMIINSGVNAWESYGMTETSSHIAIRPVSKHIDFPFQLFDGLEIKQDNRGCLIISIPDSESSYREIITNDIVKIHNPREFTIEGRIDYVINSGGKKFHPIAAERKLESFFDFPFYFSSLPDPVWGEAIVLNCCTDPTMKEKIIRILKDNLEHWQFPKQIVFKSKFLYTPNGKLIRH